METFNEKEVDKVKKEIDEVIQSSKPDMFKITNGFDKKELEQLLFDLWQLLDGYSQDETWSEWDESVRVRLKEFYKQVKGI